MDLVGTAITMVCVMSERRMNRLNNPALSVGLPAFLTKGAGMFSGLMLSQYTADMQIVEQRILRCLKLLKEVIDISEHRGIGNLRSHSCLIKGEMVNVIVANEITPN